MGYYPWLAVESSKIVSNIAKIESKKLSKLLKGLKKLKNQQRNI